MWKEVMTNGVPSLFVLHFTVNLYLFNIKQQKSSAYKQQKLTKSKFSTLSQIPFRCFIFVQKNGELAFLHLKAGSEHCTPGRVRGKPYIKRERAKPVLLKQSKPREISAFLMTRRLQFIYFFVFKETYHYRHLPNI